MPPRRETSVQAGRKRGGRGPKTPGFRAPRPLQRPKIGRIGAIRPDTGRFVDLFRPSLVQSEVHDEFVERLCYEACSLRLGDGQEAGVDVGPLIHEAAREKCERYIAIARDEGATVATGGGRPAESGLADGWFFEPTVLAGVEREHRAACEEIFGPVLSVIRFDTIDEAFDINNEVPYGLSSSIYTQDVTASFRAVEELDNGITYVNAPTIGAEAHLPFGGVKNTGNGHREGGWEVYEFYTETKVAYVDYSGTLQRAQIDVDW